MMDLSDGLSKDIATLCFDNRLGFVFGADVETHVPSAMINLADDLGVDYRDWFYHGGEEYELLFAGIPDFNPHDIEGIISGTDVNKSNLICLGHFTKSTKILIRKAVDGATEELLMHSWDHFSS
jgi:thiamine monophosphate kinase